MNRQMMGRGSIAFFATYRPPVPLDIFSCPVPPSSARDEVHLTDGVSYNYNCHSIPPPALKDLLSFLGERNRKLAAECGATAAHVHAGQVTGLVFISERSDGLETLYLALRFNSINRVKVLSLAEIYGPAAFSGTRMEDTGGIGGGFMVGARIVDHSLIYVSTKEPVESRRSPWTKVYRTNLRTGETESLTPSGQYDLSPAVSPSGKLVAVASFAGNKWRGEIENLRTNIYVMNVDTKAQGGLKRSASPLIQNGGWPTWGSDNVIFFHRGADTTLPNGTVQTAWGVFRYDITTKQTVRVTPPNFNCMTPAAISETKVAVATIRSKSGFGDVRVEAQYRHIEIFDTAAAGMVQHITLRTRPRADHYNPFVLDGGRRVGYHRCHSTRGASETDTTGIHRLQSPIKDVGLFRASGVFPTISRDGSKLAFVDNEFKSVWLADGQGLRVVYETKGPDSIFSPVWNQNPDKDILYVCMGPSFNAGKPLEICAIHNVSSGRGAQRFQLTKGMFNNAFPSSNPQGTKFVFRSTRDGGEKKHKNLYIMEKGDVGEYHDGTVTRLTNGPWTDTHCQWSPNGDWIVFSSTRDKPADKLGESDHGLDPGYFAVYLVNVSDGTVVRVIRSGIDLAGHVNHPVFSPDGRSIAVTADLAAVSVDPISLPLFVHSVRPYGDIFVVDIDPTNIKKNKDVKAFRRITHSRYENSTPCWTVLSPDDPRAQWTAIARRGFAAAMGCPYVGAGGGAGGGGESFHMTGHLIIPKRCC